jgi:predicted CopG family antitoxin
MRVAFKTKEKLEALKEHKRESFDDVLNRLIDSEPQVKDEVIKEIIEDTENHIKKYGFRSRNIDDLMKKL